MATGFTILLFVFAFSVLGFIISLAIEEEGPILFFMCMLFGCIIAGITMDGMRRVEFDKKCQQQGGTVIQQKCLKIQTVPVQ